MTRNTVSLVLRYFERSRVFEQLSMIRCTAGVRSPSQELLDGAERDMIDARESLSAEVAKLDHDLAIQVLGILSLGRR